MQTQITLNSLCIPSEDVVVRKIEGEIIIVPLASGIGDVNDELYTLNEIGQAIWEKLDGEKTLDQVVKALAIEFSSPEGEIDKDVLGFVAEMVRRGILTVKV